MASQQDDQRRFPICQIADRYYLFDIDVVSHLRRSHNICGVLTGVIPQIPQQNVFSGLPVQLLPEEARLLVEKGIAYVVEDGRWHRKIFSSLQGQDRKRYLASLNAESLKVKRSMECEARKRSEHALTKNIARRVDNASSQLPMNALERADSPHSPHQRSDTKSSKAGNDASYGITRTTTYSSFPPPDETDTRVIPSATKAYPLYKHLHALDYFLTPGLRFGCNFTVYPGDPLRFHSHFLAVGYAWDEEIPMLDIVGGGRLGTGVKKGFLIGAQKDDMVTEEPSCVRTFCIEWAGM